jgi:hypothetical protein
MNFSPESVNHRFITYSDSLSPIDHLFEIVKLTCLSRCVWRPFLEAFTRILTTCSSRGFTRCPFGYLNFKEPIYDL